MKHRYTGTLIAAAMMLSLTGCNRTPAPVYTSPEQVTLEALIEASTPSKVLEKTDRMSLECSFQGTGSTAMDACVTTQSYVKTGELIEAGERTVYSEDLYTYFYYSTDPDDGNLYVATSMGSEVQPMGQENIRQFLSSCLLGYSENTQIVKAESVDDIYQITTETTQDGQVKITDVITLDPGNGRILDVVSTFMEQADGSIPVRTGHYDYSDTIVIDSSPRDGDGSTPAEEGKLPLGELADMEGNVLDPELLAQAKVVLVNFWEPWCGPCVSEMPDLQKLYDAYKDQGLLVLGVFATSGQDADAKAILEDTGVTYPILRCNQALAAFQTDYVPTTYFADGESNILTEEPLVGAKSYEDWEKLVQEYLAR